MPISATSSAVQKDDRRVFAELVYSPSQVKAKSTPPLAVEDGSATASRMAVASGNFSSNAFAIVADHEPGNPHVLGSLSRKPDSYYGNEPLKEAQFYGYGAQLEAPTHQWTQARLGAMEGNTPVPTPAAGNSDLRTDALSTYTAPLKATVRQDAGAYHYGAAPRVGLEHGLEHYGQVANLLGKNSASAATG